MEGIKLGFHLSIAGSVANAPKEAKQKKYGAFQIFTTSSRSWRNSEITEFDRKDFVGLTRSNRIAPFAHIPYLCNPASTNGDVYRKSRIMLIDNLQNCKALGIDSLVIHTGSHLGAGSKVGIENVCETISSALEATEDVSILLENGSGYRNSVGSKFSELGEIIESVDSDRIGVCLDTCHAFAAGYDLRSDEALDKTLAEFKTYIGIEKIRFVHLNDAKHDLGSGLDRHWHIGKGHIGERGFLSLFRNRNFRSGSFVMELPEDETADHLQDMNAIKAIIEKSKE
jgi:deoxyribonuclease-4